MGLDSGTTALSAGKECPLATARDRIDPESREPLEAFLQDFPGGFFAISDLEERRAAARRRVAELTADLPPNERVTSSDLMVPGPPNADDVPVRLYRPVEAEGDLPGLMVIHGGGMVLGDVDGVDVMSQTLCDALGVVVVSTGYRKAPEHPHPAQSDDCYASLLWMAENAAELGIDPQRLAVYGSSAGGNLALAVALRARDDGGPALRFVMPIYPMVDHRNETASSQEIIDVGVWDREANLEAWRHFLGGKEPDGYAAPLHADDLSGLPPMYIDIGTVDLFRDETVALVSRLAQSGVEVEFHLYPGAYHASEMFAPNADLSRRIWERRLDALARVLHG